LEEGGKSKGIYERRSTKSSRTRKGRLETKEKGTILERKDLYFQLSYSPRRNYH